MEELLRQVCGKMEGKLTGEMLLAWNAQDGHRLLKLILEDPTNGRTQEAIAGAQVKAGIIPEEDFKAAVEKLYNDLDQDAMTVLLTEKGQNMIPVDVPSMATDFGKNWTEVVMLMLNNFDDGFEVPEDILKAVAVRSEDDRNHEVLDLVLEKGGDRLKITDDVLNAAATMASADATVTILEKRGDEIGVSQDLLEAAARNVDYGVSMVKWLLENYDLKVTEQVLKAVARNQWSGRYIMEYLLTRPEGERVTVSDEIMLTAIEYRWRSDEVVYAILENWANEITISENMLKAAAKAWNGLNIFHYFWTYKGDAISITDEVLVAAAGNESWTAKKLVTSLIAKRGKDFSVSGEMLKAAAGNKGYDGLAIMTLLLESVNNRGAIPEDVIEMMTGNSKWGTEMMALLQGEEHRREN